MRYLPMGDTDPCLVKLTQSTSQLDAKTNDVARNWRPDGNYTTTDLQRIVKGTFDLLKSGSSAIEQAIAAGAPATIRSSLTNFKGRIQSRMADALPFINATNTAINTGVRVVNAPGLKDWVVKSMVATSGGLGAVAYFACSKPALVAAFQTFMVYFDQVVSFAKAAVKVAVATGEAVLEVPHTLGVITTYAIWGGVALAAVYLFQKTRRPNPGRRRRR